MNELRLGHRVRFRNDEDEQWKYGYFVSKTSLGVYGVIGDGRDSVDYWLICELDPDAKEFLPGDEVEVRDKRDVIWQRGIYAGYDNRSNYAYGIRLCGSIYWFEECRYQQEEKDEWSKSMIQNIEELLVNIKNGDISARSVSLESCDLPGEKNLIIHLTTKKRAP